MDPMESKFNSRNMPTINCEERNDNDACQKTTDSTNSNSNNEIKKDETTVDIIQWQVEDVVQWAANDAQFTPAVIKCLQLEAIDGQVLLSLTEEDIRDFRYRLNYNLRFGELKKLWQSIYHLQQSRLQQHHLNIAAQHNPTNHIQHHSKNVNHHKNNLSIRIASLDGSPIHHNHQRIASSITAAATAGMCSCGNKNCGTFLDNCTFNDCESCAPEISSVSDGCSANIPPEFFKTSISLGYSFVVTWITSFVMVIVHERVPDMKRYPPLPDIFLDNVPHIPWAFHMCEITGTLLFSIWTCVCVFHKYRMVLLRRFFALAGTVFLLRCVTMLITSLSVPGTHLQCNQNDYAIDDTGKSFLFLVLAKRLLPVLCQRNGQALPGVIILELAKHLNLQISNALPTLIPPLKALGQCFAVRIFVAGLTLAEALYLRISRAYTIWSGLGMSIQGVRTCGDYMFSGHTVALTLLNFFITEYTPRNLYFLHTLSWLLNMFGIFFILAAHEHYSIDVFVAFYITSRLFLYYHTLANNQALMQRDSNRTRIWFPMFSYFESSVDGIIPNEFNSVGEIIDQLVHLLMEVKDSVMLTAHRFWLEAPHITMSSRNVLFVPRGALTTTKQCNAATSTSCTVNSTPTTTKAEFWRNDIMSATTNSNSLPSTATNNISNILQSNDLQSLKNNNINNDTTAKKTI